MFYKFIIAIAFIHLKCSATSHNNQIEYPSNNEDTTDPTLSIVGLGHNNVTFTWTKTGAWKDEDNFTVSILSREGLYRPLEFNASFNEYTDLLANYTFNQPYYYCDDDTCSCDFQGHFPGSFNGPYYKSCSDGVVIVQAGDVSLKANFTTAPSEHLGLRVELDGDNLVVHWNGFKDTDEGVCGRQILINIYQPVENAGWTPQGWYWPGSDYYGNILHQVTISNDVWEDKYSFYLDPKLVTDDAATQSAGAVIAYRDAGYGELITNNWNIGVMYYDGNSQSPGASVSAFLIILTSLLALMFN